MRLLLDQNLSFRLVPRLADVFRGIAHVRDFGLDDVDDELVWQYAAAHDYAILSKDSDFLHLALLRGHPPKCLYLAVGNCPTSRIEELLRLSVRNIEAFLVNESESMLVLKGGGVIQGTIYLSPV